MHIAVQVITAKSGKQLIHPLGDDCINQLWYLYIIEYYSGIEKDTVEAFVGKRKEST